MKVLYNWLIAIIQKLFTKGGLPAETEERKPFEPYFRSFDLQFFASDGDDSDDDDGDDSGDDQGDDDLDDELNLDELLKDPKFKKQYNARFKEQLGKRLKKYEGIDPEEYKRLKEQAGKGKDKKKDDPGDDLDEKLKEKEQRLLRAERREKRALVKEFAIDNGHNPKLLARLIDVDDIELDDDGEPLNLDELVDDLADELPEYFGDIADDDEDEEEEERPRKKRFTPGARQKMNKKKKVDPREAGRQKALERHKKKEEN